MIVLVLNLIILLLLLFVVCQRDAMIPDGQDMNDGGGGGGMGGLGSSLGDNGGMQTFISSIGKPGRALDL